jgi:thiol-disulfide isomerase/thioredoxin
MKKNNLRNAGYVVLLLIFFSTGHILAQTPIRRGPASVGEIKTAQAVLETDFDNLKAHKSYIYAMGLDNPLLIAQYKVWMKKYPDNMNIPLAIGTAYYNAEMPQAKDFLLRIAEKQPQNANVWFMLSGDAGKRGQNDLATQYVKKATLADPSDASYAFAYLMSFEESNPYDYKQKVYDFVKRFPTNERGAQALYWLGARAVSFNDKINYFEELRKLYPPQKFNWSSSGMIELDDIYLQTYPEKALQLANEMGEGNDWNVRKKLAASVIHINQLEQGRNFKEAIIELDKVSIPHFNYINDFIAIKKASLQEKSGKVKAAYDSLAVKFAKLPTDKLYTALELYGKKTDKNETQIGKDIETIRNSTATPAYPFELGLYTDSSKLNLSNLKGKVVLLTFWFPGCGPCKEEFPHFQAVINKFKGEKVEYLGINVFPGQDSYIIPFMKNTKYSFIPLRGNSEFAAQNYGVHGEPENFLIDKNGKIVFRGFRIDNTNHRTLELMISYLLKMDQKSN